MSLTGGETSERNSELMCDLNYVRWLNNRVKNYQQK